MALRRRRDDERAGESNGAAEGQGQRNRFRREEDREMIEAIRRNHAAVARILRRLGFAWGIVLVGVAITGWQIEHRDISRSRRAERQIAATQAMAARNEERVREATFRGCERLNRHRHDDNVEHRATWGAFVLVAGNEARLARAAGSSGQEVFRAHVAVSRAFVRLASLLRWEPLTNCREAVRDPVHYRPPRPRGFVFPRDLRALRLPPLRGP